MQVYYSYGFLNRYKQMLEAETISAYQSVLNLKTVPKVLETRHSGTFFCVLSEINHLFSEIFARKFQQLTEAGLVDYNKRYWYHEINPKRWEIPKVPEVLTLKELEAGFVVCIGTLALSAVVFCLEWLMTLKDLIVFNFIFKAFFKMQV